MEEKKYYTPSIEEFHIGFECEQMFDLMTWTESTIYETHDYVDLQYEIRHNHVRVKHLDKSDIEECGWKEISVDPQGTWIEAKIKKDEYCWELFYEIKFQMVDLRDASNYYCTEFYGGCKNKSELKKLMEQLGIHQS